jgi:hypothetical protein|tara:strand:+ start:7356 stop:7634 length:279 start_codon:yes stop_codon:yes gene_type:complete
MIKEKNMIQEIIKQLNHSCISMDELRELQGTINNLIQLKAPGLRVGMKCEVDSPRVAGMIGTILKVNNVKCKVKFDGSTFNVPKTMIQPVFV